VSRTQPHEDAPDAERRGQRAAAHNAMNANPDAPGGFAGPICSVCRFPQSAHRVVAINSWAGRRTYPVIVLGETKTRYRVKAITSMMLPGRRFVPQDGTCLVPKHAVGEGLATECGAYPGGIYGYGTKTPNTEIRHGGPDAKP
jgi:hypothetical protein